MMRNSFKKIRCSEQGNMLTELDRYLKDELEDGDPGFDVLMWRKCNCHRFPIISKIARDILKILISTVTSEYAFSTDEKVLNDFRSSLTPRIVQVLICTQDWVRKYIAFITLEEDLKELEKIDEGYCCWLDQDVRNLELVVYGGAMLRGNLIYSTFCYRLQLFDDVFESLSFWIWNIILIFWSILNMLEMFFHH